MTESTWSAEGEPPPQKRKLPVWLWWCGGGCLLAVILVGLLGVWAVGKAKELLDPDNQWAAIHEIQPFDERPVGWTPLVPMPLGRTAIYMLSAPDDTIAMLMRFEGKEAADARMALLDPEFSGSFMGLGGRKGMQEGTLEIQGRELPVLRFFQGKGSGPTGENEGPSAVVETTPAGETNRLVVWQFIRTHKRSASESEESSGTLTDEDLRALLAPFDLGEGPPSGDESGGEDGDESGR